MISRIPLKDAGLNYAAGYGGRGALLEIGVHLLDLIRFLSGQEAREVRCCGMNPMPPGAPDARAFVEITTEGGIVCTLKADRHEGDRIGVATWTGSQGRLAADWVRQEVRWAPADGPEEVRKVMPCQTVLAALRSFLEALRDGRPMPVTGLDGYRAVELADACYRSAEAGGKALTLPLVSGR
jgi:predicted dehydrogenase